MHASNSFKQAFLRHMLLGLQHNSNAYKHMSLLERKRAIKHSADAAMGLARGGTNWSRALITDLCKEDKNKIPVRSILGKEDEKPIKPRLLRKMPRSRKSFMRRSLTSHSKIRKGARRSQAVAASILARAMVKKRTRVLKRLVPGGERLDSFSLLDETLDYVISLRAQVGLMQLLVKALHAKNLNFRSE